MSGRPLLLGMDRRDVWVDVWDPSLVHSPPPSSKVCSLEDDDVIPGPSGGLTSQLQGE